MARRPMKTGHIMKGRGSAFRVGYHLIFLPLGCAHLSYSGTSSLLIVRHPPQLFPILCPHEQLPAFLELSNRLWIITSWLFDLKLSPAIQHVRRRSLYSTWGYLISHYHYQGTQEGI